MLEDFVVARNPDPDSSLPYLIRVPLPGRPIVLKAKEPWPRKAKVYCHRAEEWPANPDIVERIPTKVCLRRGSAIDLVLDRARESRSQIVLTHIKGREAIFWQSPRTAKQARPSVSLPTARASHLVDLEIIVDTHERYAYGFGHQQVSAVRETLSAGDYAVRLDGEVVAAVERKSLSDLLSSLTSGRLRFALTELSGLPRAAVVVEDRYSAVFKQSFVRPSVAADGLAELQVRFPTVPVFFAETRPLAEEWTYRFLAAAVVELSGEEGAVGRLAELQVAPPLGERPEPRTRGRRSVAVPGGPPTSAVRAWAVAEGLPVADRGRLRPEIVAAYDRAHRVTGADLERVAGDLADLANPAVMEEAWE